MDYYLGLSGNLHDCAYSITNESGNILIHSELERDVRIKEVPGNSLLYFLQDEATQMYDDGIKNIATYMHLDHLSLINALRILQDEWDESLAVQILKPNRNYQSDIGIDNCIGRLKNLIRNKELTFSIYGHHECHAFEAFARHESKEALIISIDGGGFDIQNNQMFELHTAAWQGIINTSGKKTIVPILLDKDHSLGAIYNLTTRLLGFSTGYPKGSQTGSVMGMAAWGKSNDTLDLFKDTYLWQNTSAKNLSREKVFSSRNFFTDRVTSYLEKGGSEEERLRRKFNIAAGLQDMFEEKLRIFIDEIKSIVPKKKRSTIIFTGGCSLNCAAMGKLINYLKESGFDTVSCSNIPYDAGLCIGASYLSLSKSTSSKKSVVTDRNPYLGRRYSSIEYLSIVNNNRVHAESIEIKEICNYISEGKILAIFQGCSESGRRALGNRSIIADPRNADIRKVMNEKVKHRPIWRPFAPMIIEEDVTNWFKINVKSPYMSFAIEFKDDVKKYVPSVVHEDGTGRLQTINKVQNPWIYDLLEKWKEMTGIPMLINTSFNDSEPIVESPKDALITFLSTEIDMLVLPDLGVCLKRRL